MATNYYLQDGDADAKEVFSTIMDLLDYEKYPNNNTGFTDRAYDLFEAAGFRQIDGYGGDPHNTGFARYVVNEDKKPGPEIVFENLKPAVIKVFGSKAWKKVQELAKICQVQLKPIKYITCPECGNKKAWYNPNLESSDHRHCFTCGERILSNPITGTTSHMTYAQIWKEYAPTSAGTYNQNDRTQPRVRGPFVFLP